MAVTAYPRAPDELHSQSSPTLVASTQVLKWDVQGEAVQAHRSQDPPGLHSISLPLVLVGGPAKRQLLRHKVSSH